MKKKLIAALSLMLCLLLCIPLIACGKKHEAKEEWKWDDTQHWHECAKKKHEDKLDVADHTFGEWETTKAASETEKGEKMRVCSVCSYQQTEEIPQLAHTHKFDTTKWEKNADKHWHGTTCGHNVKQDEANHTFDDGVQTKAPTETEEGVKTFTCTVCGQTKTETIPVLGHTHKFDTTKWEKDASKHWHGATCGHDVKQDEANHTFDNGVQTKAPTETEAGVKTFTCTVCGQTKTEAIPVLAHTHKFDTTKWEKDADKHWHGATCGHDVKQDEADHEFETWTTTTPAGYGTTGTEESQCPVCGYKTTRTIAALEAKTNSVTLKDGVSSSKVYNAQAIALTAADFTRNGDGTVTLSYRVKGEEGWTAVAPKNAGTYEIKVSVAATAEWKACETVIEYTIDQYELTELYNKTHTKEYDGDTDYRNKNILVPLTTPFGDNIRVQIVMKSANAGTTEFFPGIAINGTQGINYRIDESKIRAEITAKKLKFDTTNLTKVYDGTAIFRYDFTTADGLIEDDECYITFAAGSLSGSDCVNVGVYNQVITNDEVKPSNPNYEIDMDYANFGDFSEGINTKLTITKKVLSGLEFTIYRSKLEGETGTQKIEREVDGTNGKVRVNITFNIQNLRDNKKLALTTGEAGPGEATVEFNIEEGEDYENCEFAESDIGTLELLPVQIIM